MQAEQPRVRVVHASMGDKAEPKKRQGRGGLWFAVGAVAGVAGSYFAIKAAISLMESRIKLQNAQNGIAAGPSLDMLDEL